MSCIFVFMFDTDIPVTFDLNGETFKGHFSKVLGRGSNAKFDLTVNRRHWGSLSYIEGSHPDYHGPHRVEPGWRFYSPSKDGMTELSEFFGMVIISWYDSHPEQLLK
jgi:hypothetical protein